MPDDIKVLAASGDDTVAPPISTDLIGGRHYQKIKAGWGADGSFAETDDVDGLRVPVGGLQVGSLTETAPGSDTASSGLNGRLQRVAQRLTSLLALLGFRREAVLTLSVAAGATLSATGDTTGYANMGLIVPSTFDGSTISFQVSDQSAGTYVPLYDITNTPVAMTVAASRAYDLPGELMAWRFVKVQTGTAQATTATDLLLVLRS